MTVKIALLGFGNVGKGTYRTFVNNREHIKAETGIDIEVKKILKRSAPKEGDALKDLFTNDINEIINDPEITLVAEMIGGVEPASTYIIQALKAGKHVVTANKAALAANFPEIDKAAEENHVAIGYEASVGGAIPIIAGIRYLKRANEITEICGIVNGTTNYILSKMENEKLSYEDALKQAQALGYAEADPTADVEGFDAASKLCILIHDAFGVYVDPQTIPRKGISHITAEDIEKARAQQKRIKLVARASFRNGQVMANVGPEILDYCHQLAVVKNESNGILVSCNMANDVFFCGKGAGMDPTGSAVAGDIIRIIHYGFFK